MRRSAIFFSPFLVMLSACCALFESQDSNNAVLKVCKSAYEWNVSELTPAVFRVDLIPVKLAEKPPIFSEHLEGQLLKVFELDKEYNEICRTHFGGLAHGQFGLIMMRLNLPLKSWNSKCQDWKPPVITGSQATVLLHDVKTYPAGPDSITTKRTLRFHLERRGRSWVVNDIEIHDDVLDMTLSEIFSRTLLSLKEELQSIRDDSAQL